MDSIPALRKNDSEELGRQIELTKDSLREKLNELGVEVESTLDDVKRLFNLPYQMQERPWLFFGGCVALGMLVGRANRSENPFKASATVTKDSVIDTIISICDEELQQLKSVAIGTFMGTCREMAKDALPQCCSANVGKIFDAETVQLGGKAIRVGDQFGS